jgi:hypothetical protein
MKNKKPRRFRGRYKYYNESGTVIYKLYGDDELYKNKNIRRILFYSCLFILEGVGRYFQSVLPLQHRYGCFCHIR